jgi:hypothetical protein
MELHTKHVLHPVAGTDDNYAVSYSKDHQPS